MIDKLGGPAPDIQGGGVDLLEPRPEPAPPQVEPVAQEAPHHTPLAESLPVETVGSRLATEVLRTRKKMPEDLQLQADTLIDPDLPDDKLAEGFTGLVNKLSARKTGRIFKKSLLEKGEREAVERFQNSDIKPQDIVNALRASPELRKGLSPYDQKLMEDDIDALQTEAGKGSKMNLGAVRLRFKGITKKALLVGAALIAVLAMKIFRAAKDNA